MFPSVECSELDGNYAPSGIRYMGNARDSSTWWYLSVSRLFFSLSVRAEPVTFFFGVMIEGGIFLKADCR